MPMPQDWAAMAQKLIPGDILVIRHPGTHVMMYIGTLRSYGYTEKQLPSLAAYLDHPLMIHCGGNPRGVENFTRIIRTTADRRTAAANPPDGGVALALLGVPAQAADYMETACGIDYPCFDVEGCCVTAFDFSTVSWYVWYRHL